MGYFRCKNGCGTTIGKFRRDDDTYQKVPIFNAKYSGYGQFCASCLKEKLIARFEQVNVQWPSFVKFNSNMPLNKLIEIANELDPKEIQNIVKGNRLW